MTLRQLRYFDALARHSHFGRAAAACAISQPALSMQIKELEDALGAVLIERGARHVRLTQVRRRGCAARARHPALGRRAGRLRARVAGPVRGPAAPRHDPDDCALPAARGHRATSRRMHPELDIHVREALTSKLIEELAEGRLDTAIVALPVSEASLTEVALFAENFLLVRPGEDEGTPVPGERGAARDAAAPARGGALLSRPGPVVLQHALVAAAGGAGRELPLHARADGRRRHGRHADPGDGRGAWRRARRSVSVARFKDPQPSRTIGMVWRKTSPLAAQLLQLSDVVGRSARGFQSAVWCLTPGHHPQSVQRCQTQRV